MIVDLDNKAIELNSIVLNNLNQVSNVPHNIMQDIILKIITNGLRIGRWALDSDVSGNFRCVDTIRNGFYRFVKTSQRLTVDTIG